MWLAQRQPSNHWQLATVLSAEGGIRTRTGFWPRGFSYHYSFRYLLYLQFVVWTMPSPCTIRMFRREPSRLYTLLASYNANLSSALPSALPVKGSPNLTPFTPAFPSGVLKQLS